MILTCDAVDKGGGRWCWTAVVSLNPFLLRRRLLLLLLLKPNIMSEKGYTQSKGGKSAIKSSALKGKDDSPAKSKGRKVQFDSEDLFDDKFTSPVNDKSNGKDEAPFAKGKGGKGDKGGKGPAKKEPPPLVLRVDQELPENAKCLMDCEAAQLLQGIQDHMVLLSKDPTIKIPSAFDKALQYASRSNHYTDPQAVRQVLESLKKEGVSDGEMCVIANAATESVGEAFGLMPSLKAKRSKVKEPLRNALTELEKHKITKKTVVIE